MTFTPKFHSFNNYFMECLLDALCKLLELQSIGTHAAILGKALYTGRLDLKTVIEEVGAC